ncbi:hypothetical protein F528_2315 [Neisseria meningitidis 992008]|nr:hypothetical protein F528_2315 [Neisseria meningitidis 992008]
MLLKNKCRLKTFQTAFFTKAAIFFIRAAKFIRNNRNHPAVIPAKAGI